tara:strand:- start:760 stop:996 length:237 start_codon:yes stop_codon:yes gene_type:complete
MKLEKKISNYLKKNSKKKFSIYTNLIKEEYIDSYGIIELIDYIENSLKLKCPSTKISTSNFNSISLIIKFLKKYNKKI